MNDGQGTTDIVRVITKVRGVEVSIFNCEKKICDLLRSPSHHKNLFKNAALL